MSFTAPSRVNIHLAMAFLLVGSVSAAAQQNGPLFSTPASRSTTGAPILNDPNKQNGTIIPNTTGRPPQNAPRQDKQSSSPVSATPPQSGAKYKNWDLQCAEFAKGQKRCQVTGNVVSSDGKQIIFVMSLAPTADGKALATQMAVPLGIALKAGVKVDVDGAYTTTLPVSRCTTQGCLVEGTVEGALIDAMKTRPAATITVATPDGKAVPIKLPLNGFADAFAAMTAANAGGKAAQTK
jgi:invasion protein IalB